MKKNTLKRVFSAIAVSAVAVSTTSVFASAEAGENYCNKQDNKEAPYQDYYSSNPYTTIDAAEAANATVKPQITIDKIELTLEEAKANPTQTVNFTLGEGCDDKICTIGMHPIWDTRLTPAKSGRSYVKRGEAFDNFQFSENADYLDEGFLTISGMTSLPEDGMIGYNTAGVMFSMQFTIPDTAKAGDLYPIGIRYQNPGNTSDQFTSYKYDSEESMLMEAYAFTQGITNGYIKIEDEGTTTTTTTKKADTTTTTTTTKKADTTTTTKPVGDADIVFDFGNYTAKPGDKVKVSVILTANGNKISGIDAVLKQDSPIKLTNIGKTSPVFEKALVINLDESSFNFQSLDSSMEPMVVEDGGTVLTLGYEVPADCPDGVYEIGFGDKCMVFRDNSAFQYKTAKVNGFITVGDAQDTTTTTTTTKDPGTTTTTTKPVGGEYTPDWGDTDCNGTVNISDVVILNRWLHDNTYITISDQGKVNADCCDPQDPKGGKVKVSGVKLTAADSTAIIESIVHLVTLPVASK